MARVGNPQAEMTAGNTGGSLVANIKNFHCRTLHRPNTGGCFGGKPDVQTSFETRNLSCRLSKSR